ncbi:hypothetical protein ZIOFF_006106 [Zingiber officinale]|uniref:Uncharacterized protein n=1 Tax=Zingiber officinale TaxID=94328 RepID=A0A8J5I296_ZINOF|nr:hypothetical protein ZIOFF_006106 [Zingiber officinale]
MVLVNLMGLHLPSLWSSTYLVFPGVKCKIGGSLSSKGINTAEYLIQNSQCLCVGVQKKGQNTGYLLNTKTHRNFWLLA